MLITVRSLCGVGGVPNHRTSAERHLKRLGISVQKVGGVGGVNHAVDLSDLPEDVRLAYLRRELDGLDLDEGPYDDMAHSSFALAAPSRRARAERKAAIARTLAALLANGVTKGEAFALVREKHGAEGTSSLSLKRVLKAIDGVDPINFAPALLDGYKATAKRADVSEDAWRFFLTLLHHAAPQWPLKCAWRDVRDVAKKTGWHWPSYPTVFRRWQELSEAQRLHVRHGQQEAAKRLTQPAHRDKTTIAPLEWVSLDGRTKDFWTDFGDGRAVRPVFLALVDVASDMVLDWLLAPSENAAATVQLIKRVCEKYGIFDRLYTDNGSAFSGHLVAGGNVHRFRHGKAKEGVQPLGICQHMGIKLHFALPRNAQAKIAERIFATLSRAIDDRPEFRNAHAGHSPGASPSSDVVPVPVETARAVIQREVDRQNREGGRRAQGARGRSYEEIFRAGLEGRVIRRPTARQLYLSGLIWKPVAVDRFGQIHCDKWVYGGPATQGALKRFHKPGKRILLGRDPDDLSAPAIAYDEEGNPICEGIEPIRRGAYGSVEGVKLAARNGKAARKILAAAKNANNYMAEEAFRATLAFLDAPESKCAPAPQKVIAGRFGGPLDPRRKSGPQAKAPSVPDEYLRNLDTALAARRSQRGEPA